MKTFSFICTALLILSTGGCAYLDAKQGEWIFRPTEVAWRGYSAEAQRFEEVSIVLPSAKDGDAMIHAWWLPSARADAPVLLYLHGARWNLTGSSIRIPRWNEMGFSVLAIDYRGFGKSSAAPGGVPSETSANEDALAAWRYLESRSPGARKFIFGHSLGGAIATQLALKVSTADGLILEAPFTNIGEMLRASVLGFLPLSLLITQRFDSLERIEAIKIPILIAHGTSDYVVPFSMGEKLFAAAKAKKRFFRADGGSHHNLTSKFFEGYRQAVFEQFGLAATEANATATTGGGG